MLDICFENIIFLTGKWSPARHFWPGTSGKILWSWENQSLSKGKCDYTSCCLSFIILKMGTENCCHGWETLISHSVGQTLCLSICPSVPLSYCWSISQSVKVHKFLNSNNDWLTLITVLEIHLVKCFPAKVMVYIILYKFCDVLSSSQCKQ